VESVACGVLCSGVGVLETVFAVWHSARLTATEAKPNIGACDHVSSVYAPSGLWFATDVEQVVHSWLVHYVNVVSIRAAWSREQGRNKVLVLSQYSWIFRPGP
jgi:hypothetical protein